MTTAENGPRTDEVARGERFYQALLDEETRPVPVSLRATSAGYLDPSGIAPSRYFDRDFHQREVEHMWGRVWQMACREEQIPEVGDSVLYEIADWSLIVVRTAPDKISAFHNSCLHRGTQLRTRSGHIDSFRCPYHGFSWNLDGSLREIPSAWDFRTCRRGDLLPARGPGRDVGRVRLRQRRPRGATAPGLPRGSPVALRPVAPRGALPHRPRRPDDAVQLEGGARSLHRGVPHDGRAPAAADHRRRLADRVRRLRSSRQPDDHRRSASAASTSTGSSTTSRSSGPCSAPRTPTWSSNRDRAHDRCSANASAPRCASAPAATTRTSPTPSCSTASSTSCSRTSCHGPASSPSFAYRFRPDGHDPDSCVIDIMVLEPIPDGADRPPAAATRVLGPRRDVGRRRPSSASSAGSSTRTARRSAGPARAARLGAAHDDAGPLPGEPDPPLPRDPRRLPRARPLMDVRYTPEQAALRDSVAQIVDRFGPRAVGQLDDVERALTLDATIEAAGWRELRTETSRRFHVGIGCRGRDRRGGAGARPGRRPVPRTNARDGAPSSRWAPVRRRARDRGDASRPVRAGRPERARRRHRRRVRRIGVGARAARHRRVGPGVRARPRRSTSPGRRLRSSPPRASCSARYLPTPSTDGRRWR